MPLATIFDWEDFTSDSDPRSLPLEARNGDVFMVVHHAFNEDVDQTIALSKPGGRTVSMTGALGPQNPNDPHNIVAIMAVPLHRRPWTTASFIDDKAVTFECSNLDLAEPYPVVQEIKEFLALAAAHMHIDYGMPLNRWHVCDHSEVYARGWGSYATACCGADLRGSLDWIVARAVQLVQEILNPHIARPTIGENDMLIYLPTTSSADGVIRGGTSYLSDGGPLRPLSRAEFGAYDYFSPKPNANGKLVAPSEAAYGSGYNVPIRWVKWNGQAVRDATRYVGVMEQTGLAAGDVPILSGRIIYDDPAAPTFPRVSVVA